MSRYDDPETVDPAQAHVAAFQTWENMVRERGRIEQELAMSYLDLITRYREKCSECEREKRNAVLWEKEQRLAERELNGLKSAAVSLRLCWFAPPPLRGSLWFRLILAPGPGCLQTSSTQQRLET